VSGHRPAADLAERLGAAVDYLEAHLEGGASLDRAARRAGFSRWHFMRVFQAATGLSAAEYLRRRRLSRAAEALAAGATVLEVAIHWGYGSQAAFTRAYARAFGVTPAAYRRRVRAGGRPLALTHPFEPRLPWAPGRPPAPRLEARPAFRAVGLSTHTPTRRFQAFSDLPAFWADWLGQARGRAVQGAVPGAGAMGLVRVHASGEVEYVIGLPVLPGAPVPRGYRAVAVPAGRYAVFARRGEPARTAQSLALDAYTGWLPGAAARRRPGAWDLEVYLEAPGAPAPELACELWLPVDGLDVAAAPPARPPSSSQPG
jgi:AraC family transcriptional regulator